MGIHSNPKHQFPGHLTVRHSQFAVAMELEDARLPSNNSAIELNCAPVKTNFPHNLYLQHLFQNYPYTSCSLSQVANFIGKCQTVYL